MIELIGYRIIGLLFVEPVGVAVGGVVRRLIGFLTALIRISASQPESWR